MCGELTTAAALLLVAIVFAFAVVVAVGARRGILADAGIEAVADEADGVFGGRAGFGDGDVASAQAVAVEGAHGACGDVRRGHGHEGAPARNAGAGINHHFDFEDGTGGGK